MPEFFPIKENGVFKNLKRMEAYNKDLPDGKYKVTIERISKRSLPQNAYLHGILIPEFRKALNSVGYNIRTDDQAKEVLKATFLKDKIVNEETGEVLEYIKPTSGLTKEELNILIEEVIRFCAENMSYEIPYPNEQLTTGL
jgi:hypothetical protein